MIDTIRQQGMWQQGIWQRVLRWFKPEASPEGASREPAVSSEVRAVVNGGNLVLLHVGKGFMFKANSTGARIWQGLLDKRPVRRIAEELSREFGVPREVAEKDVGQFIADLELHGLLARRIVG